MASLLLHRCSEDATCQPTTQMTSISCRFHDYRKSHQRNARVTRNLTNLLPNRVRA
jgi:hypothetical protein